MAKLKGQVLIDREDLAIILDCVKRSRHGNSEEGREAYKRLRERFSATEEWKNGEFGNLAHAEELLEEYLNGEPYCDCDCDILDATGFYGPEGCNCACHEGE